jgi:2-phosphosulfolactate phosphatase
VQQHIERSNKTISVTLLPELIEPCHSLNSSSQQAGCVVIDTLRFTTTAVHAIQSGAKSILVVQDIEQARLLARTNPSAQLCGERLCRPIEGFDLGNSPLEYVSSVVADRELIFSTTNGTRAVEAASQFQQCFLASLVNRSAVARAIHQSPLSQWHILCAGTDGQVAGEDWLAAGAVVDSLHQLNPLVLNNDAAQLAWMLWRKTWDGNVVHLQNLLESFVGGQNLIRAGYEADILFASQVDLLKAVPCRIAQALFVRLDT